MASEFTWNTFVFLLKGGYEYCGIGLVEVLWKVIDIIIDWYLVDSIKFHDVLHRFRAWRGTRMATLDSKLLHNIVGCKRRSCMRYLLIHTSIMMK